MRGRNDIRLRYIGGLGGIIRYSAKLGGGSQVQLGCQAYGRSYARLGDLLPFGETLVRGSAFQQHVAVISGSCERFVVQLVQILLNQAINFSLTSVENAVHKTGEPRLLFAVKGTQIKL